MFAYFVPFSLSFRSFPRRCRNCARPPLRRVPLSLMRPFFDCLLLPSGTSVFPPLSFVVLCPVLPCLTEMIFQSIFRFPFSRSPSQGLVPSRSPSPTPMVMDHPRRSSLGRLTLHLPFVACIYRLQCHAPPSCSCLVFPRSHHPFFSPLGVPPARSVYVFRYSQS